MPDEKLTKSLRRKGKYVRVAIYSDLADLFSSLGVASVQFNRNSVKTGLLPQCLCKHYQLLRHNENKSALASGCGCFLLSCRAAFRFGFLKNIANTRTAHTTTIKLFFPVWPLQPAIALISSFYRLQHKSKQTFTCKWLFLTSSFIFRQLPTLLFIDIHVIGISWCMKARFCCLYFIWIR